MTTNYHTPHSFGAPLTAAELNTPLASLDSAISNIASLNVKTYGALGNGIADDTAAIQAAINAASAAGSGEVFVPDGTYLVLSLQLKTNVTLRLAAGAILRKNGGGTGTHVVEGIGTVTATTTTLTSSPAMGVKSIAVTSATGFSVGDYIVIYDSTFAYGATGRNQEINRIVSIVGTTIGLARSTIAPYSTGATATMAKLTAVANCGITGRGRVEVPTGTSGGCAYFNYATGVIVDGPTFAGANDDAGVYLKSCSSSVIRGINILDGQNTGTGGFGYGICLDESSHDIYISGGYSENIRENPITNGSRYIVVNGWMAAGHAQDAWNTHGTGVSHVTISKVDARGCANGIAISFATANAQDSDIAVIGCHIVGNGAGSGITSVGSSGKVNNRIQIENNYVSNVSVGINVVWTNAATVEGNVATAFTSYGVFVNNCTDYNVTGNTCNNFSGPAGIYSTTNTNGLIDGNHVGNGSASPSYGIEFNNCTLLLVTGNLIRGVTNNNIYSVGTNTQTVVQGNSADDATYVKQAGEKWLNNSWGAAMERPNFMPVGTASLGTQQDNYALPATNCILFVTATASFHFTGFAAGMGGDMVIIVNNSGTNTITIDYNSASSSAANKVFCPNGVNFVIPVRGAAMLVYNDNASVWQLLGPVA